MDKVAVPPRVVPLCVVPPCVVPLRVVPLCVVPLCVVPPCVSVYLFQLGGGGEVLPAGHGQGGGRQRRHAGRQVGTAAQQPRPRVQETQVSRTNQ